MMRNVHVTGAQGEVDPVYSFLKLTSVIPREGASVMPDEDHYCCSKTDQDIGVVANDTAGHWKLTVQYLRTCSRPSLELQQ